MIELDPLAARTRLTTLLEFLESIPDKVKVVISPRAREGNLLIVGDWFSAESLVPRPGEGYRQTVFTWHAPTVLHQTRNFDQEFKELCRADKLDPGASVTKAIGQIKKIVRTLHRARPAKAIRAIRSNKP